MLWRALVTFPLMASIQLIWARIGLVCGCGLAGVMRRHYPPTLVYILVLSLVIANTINAAADLAAIAAGVNLLLAIPIAFLILPIGLFILAVQVWGSYRFIAKTFKWLTLSLFAYIGAAFFAGPDWHGVLKGTLFPSLRFDNSFFMMFVAILGTTISPYLFFWQANQEVEEEMAHGSKKLRQRKGATDGELKDAAWDVNIGMFLSNVVMYISTVVALFIAYWEIDVMKALFWTAVINGFLSPPLLVIIMLIANNRAIMGKRVNSRALNVLGWTTSFVMFAAAIALVVTWGNS